MHRLSSVSVALQAGDHDVATTACTALVAARSKGSVSLLDYGAGNVRSVRNAIRACGYDVVDIVQPGDILKADKLVFPGVGSFGFCMQRLTEGGFVEPLKQYIAEDRPLLGVCLGMQLFFEGSEETPGVAGLGVIPGMVTRFSDPNVAVPHMGWNGTRTVRPGTSTLFDGITPADKLYFVHSFRASLSEANSDWVLAMTDYGDSDQTFVAAVHKGNVMATQFHPEKSGAIGLKMLGNFLDASAIVSPPPVVISAGLHRPTASNRTELARRVIACLDVRSNDAGDLVVTKGDQYDVREKDGDNAVRNLGKPVELAGRYYREGADEVIFLNITAFRDTPIDDMPMQEVLQRASEGVFVPLCIGGGIRDYTDSNGTAYAAVDVASSYFRSGADKVSLGSDAVLIAEAYHQSGGQKDGTTAVETISHRYGAQAVVISTDPKRQYLADATPPGGYGPSGNGLPPPTVVAMSSPADYGPNGEQFAWYACTIKGGRETRPLDAIGLATACEALGAGEILLNCIDKDGTNSVSTLFARAKVQGPPSQ